MNWNLCDLIAAARGTRSGAAYYAHRDATAEQCRRAASYAERHTDSADRANVARTLEEWAAERDDTHDICPVAVTP